MDELNIKWYWYFNMLFSEMCLSQNLHKLESCISRTLNKIFNRILEVFVIEFLDDFLRGGNQKHCIKGETMQWPKEKVETMIYKTLH